jgi:hypothetical protein
MTWLFVLITNVATSTRPESQPVWDDRRSSMSTSHSDVVAVASFKRARGSAADVAVSLVFHGGRLIRILLPYGSAPGEVVAGNRTVHQEPVGSGRGLASSMCPIMIHHSARPAGIVIGGSTAALRMIFGVGVQPVPFAISSSAAFWGSTPASGRLVVASGLLTDVRICPRGRVRMRCITGAVGSTTAVEAE